MNRIKKRLHGNCMALYESGRTLRDMYGILFSGEEMRSLTMCETVASLRIRTVTYGEVRELVETLAPAIKEAVGDRDRYIGLCGQNSVRWVILFWAILRSGNRPYLVNLQGGEETALSVLKTLDVAAVIGTDEKTAFPCKNLLFAELEAAGKKSEKLPFHAPFGNHVAIATNGTTLREKICVYTGENFSEQVLNTEEIVAENPDMMGDPVHGVKQLMLLPLYHIFGFCASFLWFCFFGATFVFPPSLAPDMLLHTARRCEVTHVFAVPLFWHAIEKAVYRELMQKDEKTQERFRRGIEHSLKLQKVFPRFGRRLVTRKMREVRTKLLPDSVRFCISGGSHLKPSALRLVNALGYPLANGYGMSEIGITSVELSGNAADRVRSSVGKPFRSVEYRVSESGHLLVRGSSLCDALIVNGETVPMTDWFDTGDLMRMDGDGRYYFEGRASDVIVGENGENLNPDRIGQAFSLHGAVNLTVIGDEKTEQPVLIVQIPEEFLPEEWELLEKEIETCNAALPISMQVRGVRYTRDALMRPQDIKVSRTYLRREIGEGRVRFVDRYTSETDTAADGESGIRKKIRALFAEILDIPEDAVAGDAHFMIDLGGSSLDYFTLIGELDRAFGVKLPYETESFGYCLDDFEQLIKELLKASCMNSSVGSP